MNCYLSTHCGGMETGFFRERSVDRSKLDRLEPHQSKKARAKKVDYARPADFCQIFDDHLDGLFTLSLLLTADRHKADQCFVSGLEDCLQGNPVFREWAQSWARRTVIKHAIRMISPLRNETDTTALLLEPLSEAGAAVAAITSLPPFDRFVYVLSVLERYSDRECSLLMDCPVEKVVAARMRALERLANVVHQGAAETAVQTVSEVPAIPTAPQPLEKSYGEAS